ncbi:hypothetical protein [Ruegeria profundi]|uniref:hypothetical protein n=1 Tax=Ruegeria profundi TaxID=1685378 RepID=UPI001CD531C2|nr:hypothetical protein [Ruegeria profundi]MCA0930175.1 hypothetical protein [Ruegeria profundi]
MSKKGSYIGGGSIINVGVDTSHYGRNTSKSKKTKKGHKGGKGLEPGYEPIRDRKTQKWLQEANKRKGNNAGTPFGTFSKPKRSKKKSGIS